MCRENLKEYARSGDKFSKCEASSDCPAAGINVPAIEFERSAFYAFSEFWYSMEDVLRIGGPYIYDKFRAASKVKPEKSLILYTCS